MEPTKPINAPPGSSNEQVNAMSTMVMCGYILVARGLALNVFTEGETCSVCCTLRHSEILLQAGTKPNADRDTRAGKSATQYEGTEAASGAKENSDSCVNQKTSSTAGQAGREAAKGAPSNRLSLKKRMRVS